MTMYLLKALSFSRVLWWCVLIRVGWCVLIPELGRRNSVSFSMPVKQGSSVFIFAWLCRRTHFSTVSCRYVIINHFYIALFSALEQTHCARMWFYMSEYFFYSAFLNIHRSGVLTALAWLVPQESAARESQSRRVLCTPYDHAPCHFMQSHIRKVYACLAVTCHLHFWQDDRGLLRATAVTRGWNGYRNKSQHRKLTLEKKILPPLQQGFEHVTFQSRVRRSNHWAIPAPSGCWKMLFIYCAYIHVLAVKC